MHKMAVRFILLLVFLAMVLPGDAAATAGKKLEPGVYLYTGTNYFGKYYHITRDCSLIPDNRYITDQGPRAYVNFNDKISSIRLVGISSIAVYTDANYQGNCDTITRDMPNLNKTNVGNDTISSVKVNARCSLAEPSVTLYDKQNFQGRSLTITSNTPDLGASNFRNRVASFKLYKINSIAVFNRSGYQGTCQTFTRSCPSLAGTEIGSNSISSIKLNSECARHLELIVQNKSAMLIQVRKGGERKEIASGASKTYYIVPESQVLFSIYALAPLGELAPFPEWQQVCSFNFFMGRHVTVTVKGSYFSEMRCERTDHF